MFISRALKDVTQTINRWNIGGALGMKELSDLATDDRSVWESGNCIILAETMSGTETELRVVPVKKRCPATATFSTWNELIKKLGAAQWISEAEGIGELGFDEYRERERAQIDETEWKAEHRRLIAERVTFFNADVVQSADDLERLIQKQIEYEWSQIAEQREEARRRLSETAEFDKLTVEEAARQYLTAYTKPPTTQAQSPAPKTTKWTTDRVAFETYRATVKMLRANYVLVFLAILAIIVAIILARPSLWGIFQNFIFAATPTFTPIPAPPIATP